MENYVMTVVVVKQIETIVKTQNQALKIKKFFQDAWVA